METKLSQDENKFQKWAEFLYEYDRKFWGPNKYDADFIPEELKKTDGANGEEHDAYVKSVIALMFKNLNKKMKAFSCSDKPYVNFCFAFLTNSYRQLSQDPDYWRGFPGSYIAKLVCDFISVISWVGIGYFVNAILSRKSKRKFLLNIFAGIFDTAACGFIIYSLVVGAPLFSVPMILAGIVSLVLRFVFAIIISKNISENKEYIQYNNETFYPMLEEINNYLKKNKPLEQKHEEKKEENKIDMEEIEKNGEEK